MATIYLAGGLFNAAERLHNLFLEKYLKELNYNVILPQREALKFFDTNHFNISGIVEDCRQACTNCRHIFVGNIDGADADSGTCVEYGMAIITTGKAIVYRTDLRTVEEKELGVNAMLKAKGTTLIHHPCFFTELAEVEAYYKELAQKIHIVIQRIEKETEF